MLKTPRIKKSKLEYTQGYDDLPRFSSYLTQFKWVQYFGKQYSILEIGKGNGTVSSYLRNIGYHVTTFDYDSNLDPDISGDVRCMQLDNASYDIIICCEVLEHLPFHDFELALREIHRVSKKHVILSIPYSCMRFECVLRIQDIIRSLRLRIPCFFLKPKRNSEHYWEMGRRGYPRTRIRKAVIRTGFSILKEESPILNPWHYFFILEKQHD